MKEEIDEEDKNANISHFWKIQNANIKLTQIFYHTDQLKIPENVFLNSV